MIDEIVDLNDRIIGTLFNRARHRHEQQFQESGKAINEKVRLFYRVGQALLAAKQNGGDPYKAIEAVIPWEAFTRSVTEAEKLAQPEDFDYLHRIGDGYSQVRRYAACVPRSAALEGRPGGSRHPEGRGDAQGTQRRQHPQGAGRRAEELRQEAMGGPGLHAAGVDRRFYELCILSELKTRCGPATSGYRVAPVQGLRRVPGYGREVRPAQTGRRTAAGGGGRLRRVPGRATPVARTAARRRRPHGAGQRTTRRDHHRVRLEGHTAGQLGARRSRHPDAAGLRVAAARQDHRTADGSGRVDGVHPAFHPYQERRAGERQDAIAHRDPLGRGQPRAGQDGGIVPRHDLREALLATSLARP